MKKAEDLDLEKEIQMLQREEKSVCVEGAGVVLKCHVRPEVISGQPMFCVDLLVKAIEDSRRRLSSPSPP